MPGRSKSKTKVHQLEAAEREKWMQVAISMYNEEKKKDSGQGLRAVCTEVERQCYEETGKQTKIDKSTLQRRANGGRSIADFNAEKGWLTQEEADIVVTYALELADRGFPLSQRRIKEHVDQICRARYGNQFPATGVGKQWTSRFVEKHSERLHPYWSHPLDKSRARAVNEATKDKYFSLLKMAIEGEDGEEPVPTELIYGVDETGIQEGVGVREWVYGRPGKGTQHQQRSGDRENITVIETICADGTSLDPAVIFRGEGYQTDWKQLNPLHASYVTHFISY